MVRMLEVHMKLNELLENTDEWESIDTDINNLPYEDQRFQIFADPSSIEYLTNPSEDLQLTAIRNHGQYIKYIKNPTRNVITKALTDPNFVQNVQTYDPYVRKLFKDNTLMMNKWLRYAENVRGK